MTERTVIIMSLWLGLCMVVGAHAALPVTDGLLVHLDPANIQTEYDEPNDIYYVTGWTDAVTSDAAGANDFAASSELKKPLLAPGHANGHDAVRFVHDAANPDSLTAAHNDALNPGAGGYTVAIVAWVDNSVFDSGNTILRKGNSANSADEGWTIYMQSGDRLGFRLATEGGVFDDPHRSGRLFSMLGHYNEYFIGVIVLDGTNETAYFNGSDSYHQTWNGGTYTAGPINPPDNIHMGHRTQGYMAEAAIYNRELTAGELEQVGSYLAGKYLIPSEYPPTTCGTLWLNNDGMQADLNQDCRINLLDFAGLAARWMYNYDPAS